MDSRNRKIEIQIRGIFALILSLNLEQVEEIKAEVESDISQVFETDDIFIF